MPNFPPAVIGTDVQPLTPAEQAFARLQERWEQDEGGYNLIQETRPQTLAYGLHDSPAGLAAWIVEKWLAWTGEPGRGGPPLQPRPAPGQRHALLGDRDRQRGEPLVLRAGPRDPRASTARITVPTGVALTSEAIQRPPRELAERSFADIRRWVDLPHGGHFVAGEAPEVLAEELRAFFRPFRSARGL